MTHIRQSSYVASRPTTSQHLLSCSPESLRKRALPALHCPPANVGDKAASVVKVRAPHPTPYTRHPEVTSRLTPHPIPLALTPGGWQFLMSKAPP
jgi:hypothetical protein